MQLKVQRVIVGKRRSAERRWFWQRGRFRDELLKNHVRTADRRWFWQRGRFRDELLKNHVRTADASWFWQLKLQRETDGERRSAGRRWFW